MPQIRRQGFIWVHRDKTTSYSILINNIDVTSRVISSEWTRSIIGLESPCKLTLIDVDGDYARTYVGGETIELKLDFSSGTTSQWKGKLERPKRKFGGGYTLEIVGSHFQSDLLDVTVTEQYTGTKTANTVYAELISEYLSGHTTTNVLASTALVTINWDNKPLWDCLVDLCEIANFDAYVDSDKDHHFFARESIENTTDAIVWGDNLLEIENLGTDLIDVRNRIIVYGEDSVGLPIIYQTEDATSISENGGTAKEEVVRDSSIRTYGQAKAVGDAKLQQQKDQATKGEASSSILPDIHPGDILRVTSPPQQVHSQLRLIKYTHFLPIEQTKVVLAKEKTIPQIFKDRRKEEQRLAKITNPHKMTNSFNFVFDDLSEIDQNLSTTVTVSDGKLKISSGVTGTMISLARVSSSSLTFVHLKVVGDTLSGAAFHVSTDNGDTYQAVNLETFTSVPAGTQLRLKIELTNTSTLIDSVALLYK